jgi:hypothetical protein
MFQITKTLGMNQADNGIPGNSKGGKSRTDRESEEKVKI